MEDQRTGTARQVYSLSRSGRRQLEKEAAHWDRLSGAISSVVGLTEA